MKRIFALLLSVGMVYLSSCNNDTQDTNLLVVPAKDSVSKGSYFQIAFNDLQRPNDSTHAFLINDLILNNKAVYTLQASMVCRPPDSLFAISILITDHSSKQMAMKLYLEDSTKTMLGNYYLVNNQSTFTDYSRGENKNFAIALKGSVVNITHEASDCMTGTFTLQLYYDKQTTPATGSFKIFH